MKCVSAQAGEDDAIAFFKAVLDRSFDGADLSAFIVTKALCRQGVPKRAWTIAGLPSGGR